MNQTAFPYRDLSFGRTGSIGLSERPIHGSPGAQHHGERCVTKPAGHSGTYPGISDKAADGSSANCRACGNAASAVPSHTTAPTRPPTPEPAIDLSTGKTPAGGEETGQQPDSHSVIPCTTSPPPLTGDCGGLCSSEFWQAALTQGGGVALIDLVKAEVDCRADEPGNPRNIPPLQWPIRAVFDPELVQLLLENGVDPNDEILTIGRQGPGYAPALIVAITFANQFTNPVSPPAFMEWHRERLIESGAGDTNWFKELSTDDLAEDTVAIVKLLLEHGADPTYTGEHDTVQPALLQAVGIYGPSGWSIYDWPHNKTMIKMLLEYSTESEFSPQHLNTLGHAILDTQADADIIGMLADAGIRPLYRDDDPPLHTAAKRGVENPGTYKGLVQLGYDKNAVDAEGMTPCDYLLEEPARFSRQLYEMGMKRELDLDAAEEFLCN